MKRRAFMISAGGVAAGMVLLPRMAMAEAGKIDWYTNSDTNILDFWTNTVAPKFQAANPGITLNLVDAGDGMDAIAQRALAALQTKTDPQADFIEQGDPLSPKGAMEAGLYANLKDSLTNWSKVNPLAIETDFAVPYRGSQVLLAHDTTKLAAADAPKTFADLITWIKANPGQFIYNRPDKGGSGGNFVRRAIHEVNGRDPKVFTMDNFSAENAEKLLTPAWELLKDLAPSLFEGGAYTAGNTPSLQLLGQGAVAMIPAWSDMALQGISTGVLAETTALFQLTDLAFCGGFARSIVFANGANKDAALKLADFVLTEEIQSAIITELGGFPGVGWDYVSADLRAKYQAVVPSSIPTFPGGDWDSAINDGWYRNVAPNVDRNA
ncbi:extracellular solute-binding protein [Devosia sp.]|uniref:extracellular solute-binding protein n=1 Tax=Devosia sp. TaxID=1871048 RepID=UPI003BAA571B